MLQRKRRIRPANEYRLLHSKKPHCQPTFKGGNAAVLRPLPIPLPYYNAMGLKRYRKTRPTNASNYVFSIIKDCTPIRFLCKGPPAKVPFAFD